MPFTRQTELRRELLNPQNHAVFWVGHANRAEDMAAAGMYDDRGFNMVEIFQEVHQNIKFIPAFLLIGFHLYNMKYCQCESNECC